MKILVVDDHVLIREALRNVFVELQADATVLEAPDGNLALQLIEQHADVDLVVIDLGLPDRDGFSLLAELRERDPLLPIVVLSARNDRASVMKALDLGALGFIPKNGRREIMLNALRIVLAGGMYIPPEALALRDAAPAAPARPAAQQPSGLPDELNLSARQIEVLSLMMRGKSNKAIGRALALAEPTVKYHVTAILKALKVTNRTEAVMTVLERGWDPARIAIDGLRARRL
ncbi:two component transcriptional regulator, LuxR family [Rhizobiales bacterium GAS113]|nr:two component transcriptional regulator, LuxR family [Rhizobiales bacterium GAS113]